MESFNSLFAHDLIDQRALGSVLQSQEEESKVCTEGRKLLVQCIEIMMLWHVAAMTRQFTDFLRKFVCFVQL